MHQDIAISLKNVSKTFYIAEDKKETVRDLVVSLFNQGKSKKFKALDDVSFDIRKGEFIGIIGRNGSGKSTLLKMIAGIYDSDPGGVIEINGTLVPFLELGVGFNLELTGKENIFLNGAILGLTRKEIQAKYDDIVEFSELQEFINTPVKNYSSGMKVRLAFSIAVQTDADIYILDEILGVGDGAFRSKSVGVIRDMVEKGKTVIYVSHSMGSVQRYCNRVIWINKGKKIFEGDTIEGIDRYNESLLAIEKAQEREMEGKSENEGEFELVRSKVRTQGDNKIAFRFGLKNNSHKGAYTARIDLYRDDEYSIFSTTSNAYGLVFNKDQTNISVTLEGINLLEGTYFADLILLDEKGDSVVQKVHKAIRFHAYNKGNYDKSAGVVHFDANWKVEEAAI